MATALRWAAFALLCALIALWTGLGPAPELEVRAVPHQTQFGRIFPGYPVGAQFSSRSGRLAALELALVDLGGERTPLELTLRRAPGGEVLERVALRADELPDGDGWVRVEFSRPWSFDAPAALHFELSSERPSSHSPWVRYRGVPHVVRPWGGRVLPGGALEFELSLLPHSNLRALALAVDGMDCAAGPATVTLSDPRTGQPVRRGEVLQRSPQAAAWVFFTLDELAEARWKPWSVRFELPADARPIGDASGPSLIAFHARAVADPALLGLTCGAASFADRDLIFRAWGVDSPSERWLRLRERGGLALALAAMCFVASSIALGLCVARAARASSAS